MTVFATPRVPAILVLPVRVEAPVTLNVPPTEVFPVRVEAPVTPKVPPTVVFPVKDREPDDIVTPPWFAVPTVPPEQENVASGVKLFGVVPKALEDIIHIFANVFPLYPTAGSMNNAAHTIVPSL